MGMTIKEVLAKNVPANAFVYLPKKNLFLFVNSIVDYDNKLEFIFEIDAEQEIVYTFLYNEKVSVVADYSTEMCYINN